MIDKQTLTLAAIMLLVGFITGGIVCSKTDTKIEVKTVTETKTVEVPKIIHKQVRVTEIETVYVEAELDTFITKKTATTFQTDTTLTTDYGDSLHLKIQDDVDVSYVETFGWFDIGLKKSLTLTTTRYDTTFYREPSYTFWLQPEATLQGWSPGIGAMVGIKEFGVGASFRKAYPPEYRVGYLLSF